LEKKRVEGLVSGKHGLVMFFDYILKNQKISVGDLVVTSGLEKNIPFGLLIGRVEKITTQSDDLFQKAILSPLISFDNLRILTVLVSQS